MIRDLLRFSAEIFLVAVALFAPILLLGLGVVALIAWGES